MVMVYKGEKVACPSCGEAVLTAARDISENDAVKDRTLWEENIKPSDIVADTFSCNSCGTAVWRSNFPGYQLHTERRGWV